MKKLLPSFFLILFGFIASFYLLSSRNHFALAATANHIVISEIKTAGLEPSHDFVELYNPTDTDINLGDYRLVKRTSTGTDDTSIIAFTADDIIPSHGYFLWCNTDLSLLITCDKISNQTVSNDNSIALRLGDINSGEIIDAVTIGSPLNTLGEGGSLSDPEANTSIERKANSSSTPESMSSGGIDELMGNGEDTNENSSDFILRTSSQPQSKISNIERLNESPTDEPTSSPNPTEEITPSPTEELTPTPTDEPTSTPTPIITTTPVPTTTPSITPSPTPKVIFENRNMTCRLNYRPLRFFRKTINIPFNVSCVRI